MTKKATQVPVDAKIKESVENGVEKAIEVQATYNQIFDLISKRTMTVAEELTSAVSSTQHEFLAAYKAMASEPNAYAKNMATWMDSLTEVQGRSLAIVKAIYQEQSAGANEIKELVEPFALNSKKFAEGTKEWMGAWSNPFAKFAA